MKTEFFDKAEENLKAARIYRKGDRIMINFKQKELIHSFFSSVKERFPEVEFLNVTESPENPADLWINITEPENEDREIELIEFAGDKTADILLDYGYYISVMPRTVKEAELIKQSSSDAAAQQQQFLIHPAL